MPNDHNSTQVAEALSRFWGEAQSPDLFLYVRRVYSIDVKKIPEFRCLYIGETEDGDLKTGPMGGLIKQWWVIDDEGFREVRIPTMDWGGESDFVPTPRILFYRDGDGITISERLGQRMACLKSGRIHVTGAEAAIVDLIQLDR